MTKTAREHALTNIPAAIVAWTICGLSREVVAAMTRQTPEQVSLVLHSRGKFDACGVYTITREQHEWLRLPDYIPLRSDAWRGAIPLSRRYLNLLHSAD